MLHYLIGLFLGVGTLYWALSEGSNQLSIYVNLPGVLIVGGGTFATIIMTTKFKELKTFLKSILKMSRYNFSKQEWNKQLLLCSSKYEKGDTPNDTPFDSMNKVIELIKFGVDKKDIKKIMQERKKLRLEEVELSQEIIDSIVKYPPVFGMIGTLIGIMALFTNISDENLRSQIGLNLSVALTTSLYGQILANFIFAPVGDLFVRHQKEIEREFESLGEVIDHWCNNETALIVKEQIGESHAA